MDMSTNRVLRNGVQMPWMQLGTWQVEDEKQCVDAILMALNAGYRGIDTAQAYENEAFVGRAIKESGKKRSDIFVTTKLWNRYQGSEAPVKAFEMSLEKLGLDYVDLYLMHWPMKEKYIITWKTICDLYLKGYIRAIGVSNCSPHHIQDMITATGIVPMVNQVELHPYHSQKELLKYCRARDIAVEAYSPLMRGNLNDPVLAELARKYGKTPAQIVLRWDIQNGVIVAPKSVHEARIIENSRIFDFELSQEDMLRIDGLNRCQRYLPDPDVDPFD